MAKGRAFACAVALHFAAACQSPIELTYRSVELRDLSVGVHSGPMGPWVSVEGNVAGLASLSPDEALQVLVTTESGDSLWIDLRPALCGGAVTTICNEILVGVRLGADLLTLHAAVADMDAAFIWSSQSLGGESVRLIRIFSGETGEALRLLREWQEVEYADLHHTGDPGTGASSAPQFLRAILPTNAMTPPPPSARLAIIGGQLVKVTYIQPDGSRLVATSSVQQPRNSR